MLERNREFVKSFEELGMELMESVGGLFFVSGVWII